MRKVLFLLITLALSANAIDRYIYFKDRNNYFIAMENTEEVTSQGISMWFEKKYPASGKKKIDKTMYKVTNYGHCTDIFMVAYSKKNAVESANIICGTIVPNTIAAHMLEYLKADDEKRREMGIPVKVVTADKKCSEICYNQKFDGKDTGTSENKIEQWERCMNACPDE